MARQTADIVPQKGLEDWLEDIEDEASIAEDIFDNWPEGLGHPDPVSPPEDLDMLDDLDDTAMAGLLQESIPPLQDLTPSTFDSSPSTVSMGQTPENDLDWESVQPHSASSAFTQHSALGDLIDSDKASSYQGFHQPMQSASDERDLERTLPAYIRLRPFRTFLDLKDLAVTKAEMFRHSPNTIFELFARVVYSSRENLVRKQYFQFEDLFAVPSSYMSGVLTEWDPHGDVEWAADQFLAPNDPGLKCYCRCLLVPELRSQLGWSAVIQDIRPLTWKEIRSVEDHLELATN
jgi:hypothetical protein